MVAETNGVTMGTEASATTDIGTIVRTLRFLASGWVESTDDQQWLAQVANEIEQRQVSDMVSCPLCQEVACDDHCPMYPHRRPYWLGP